MTKLPVPLSFEWDETNKEKNWTKHGVLFKEAEEIFLGNTKIRIFPDKKHSLTEERFLALGVTNNGRKLTVIFTVRKGKLRIISARNQNRKERTKHAEKED